MTWSIICKIYVTKAAGAPNSCNNIETEESSDGYQLSHGPVLSEGPDCSFIQPGMTAQESANLIFGVGSTQAMWSHTQGGCIVIAGGLKHHLGTSKRVQHHSMLSKSNTSDPKSKLIKDTAAAYRHNPTHSSETHIFRNEANPKSNLLPIQIWRSY
ncbi:hypothetical protein COCC4DRAFT_71975 [Bipolaris maydis ATCC 48331]|uniref:Uncharacterized protein n=2 Tax=Cochliobolus heterostrophus TaxID=5016 RepID=M2UL26_COCH5|nr:uncharacterized protein COCC4DRAFT_71975 [Bipolaris maydis ATCC 48331]EMD88693.1 hypothetical protein COCHEDRAFT_1196633 [Bipolaris maydis C5]ENI05590.1 hypothetical protein COCC4DRAFT_71975 [Bipolaris maydis ATCC 48331]